LKGRADIEPSRLRLAYQLSVPSKTFCIGEYAALAGGPSLTLATKPRFRLDIERSVSLASQIESGLRVDDIIADSKKTGFQKLVDMFHPQSPAGRKLVDSGDAYRMAGLWQDPHLGLGGFGGSSAEYIMIRGLGALLKGEPVPFISRMHLLQEIQAYRATVNEGMKPSGADLVGQLAGRCTWWAQTSDVCNSSPWVFSDISFLLIRTGEKVLTHGHIAEVVLDPNWLALSARLSDWSELALEAWSSRRSDGFVHALKGFSEELSLAGLVAQRTRDMIEQFANVPECLAAKGCGAMGADVVLVLVEREKRDLLRKKILDMSFDCVASEDDLSTGADWRSV
jgi:mevalonate kinase